MLTQNVMNWQRYKVFSKFMQNHITGRESSCKNYLVDFPSFLGVLKRKIVDGLKKSTDLQQRDSRRSLPNKEEDAWEATGRLDLRMQLFLQLLTQEFWSTELHFGKKLSLLSFCEKLEKNFTQRWQPLNEIWRQSHTYCALVISSLWLYDIILVINNLWNKAPYSIIPMGIAGRAMTGRDKMLTTKYKYMCNFEFFRWYTQ